MDIDAIQIKTIEDEAEKHLQLHLIPDGKIFINQENLIKSLNFKPILDIWNNDLSFGFFTSNEIKSMQRSDEDNIYLCKFKVKINSFRFRNKSCCECNVIVNKRTDWIIFQDGEIMHNWRCGANGRQAIAIENHNYKLGIG